MSEIFDVTLPSTREMSQNPHKGEGSPRIAVELQLQLSTEQHFPPMQLNVPSRFMPQLQANYQYRFIRDISNFPNVVYRSVQKI